MAKSDRGFASMDPQRRREIASQGGKASRKRRKQPVTEEEFLEEEYE